MFPTLARSTISAAGMGRPVAGWIWTGPRGKSRSAFSTMRIDCSISSMRTR